MTQRISPRTLFALAALIIPCDALADSVRRLGDQCHPFFFLLHTNRSPLATQLSNATASVPHYPYLGITWDIFLHNRQRETVFDAEQNARIVANAEEYSAAYSGAAMRVGICVTHTSSRRCRTYSMVRD